MKFKEKCSCGASLSIPVPPRATTDWEDWVMTHLETWRTTHRCSEKSDTPQLSEYGDMPTVVESTARVEMAMPFGFTRELEGDLA